MKARIGNDSFHKIPQTINWLKSIATRFGFFATLMQELRSCANLANSLNRLKTQKNAVQELALAKKCAAQVDQLTIIVTSGLAKPRNFPLINLVNLILVQKLLGIPQIQPLAHKHIKQIRINVAIQFEFSEYFH